MFFVLWFGALMKRWVFTIKLNIKKWTHNLNFSILEGLIKRLGDVQNKYLCHLKPSLKPFKPGDRCLLVGISSEAQQIYFCIPQHKNLTGKYMIFVTASHQTGVDTRSKARRPIKVGIKETRTLLVIDQLSAMWV